MTRTNYTLWYEYQVLSEFRSPRPIIGRNIAEALDNMDLIDIQCLLQEVVHSL